METPANAPARQAITVRPAGGPAADRDREPAAADRPALELPGLIASGGRRPAKTGGPGVTVSKPGAIHAVLLSHDQHAGNACLIFPACLTPPEADDDQHCPAP
jgi:hypothetical protein